MTNSSVAQLHAGPGIGADAMPAVVWRFDGPRRVLSSASVGGDHPLVDWVMNTRVPADYARHDLDDHAAELAAHFGLHGNGITLFTAADVSKIESRSVGGVTVDVTVGLGKPTWAADPSGSWTSAPPPPGTINIVVQLPVAVHHSAAVNAVITITEAKTQALHELEVPGTGTASDAVVICWPTGPPTEAFCGPRSQYGAQLALATHAAVVAGTHAQRRWQQMQREG